LNFLANELELSECILAALEIGLGHLKHSVLETFGGDLCSLGSVYEGLADVTHREHSRGLNIVPILTGV